MNAQHRRIDGFTLIELLTVIAIIGILTALTATTLPRAIEKARIASTVNIFAQLRTALTEYTGANASYPPAYGYLCKDFRDILLVAMQENGNRPLAPIGFPRLQSSFFNAWPYTRYLFEQTNPDVEDNWAESADTDRDGIISPLEFDPINLSASPCRNDNAIFLPVLNDLDNERAEQADLTERDIIFIPVNRRQAEKAAEIWNGQARRNANGTLGMPYDVRKRADLTPFRNMIFPPAQYDAYVLISIGPSGNTGGIFPGLTPADLAAQGLPPHYMYHVLGMMTYYIATRDANGNGERDFDFRSRKGGVESKDLQGANQWYKLPADYNPAEPNSESATAGPLIFVSP